MSELKIKGKLIAVMDTQQVTDTFSKREFVIETDEQYPQMVKFELTQAKCSDIDNHKVGDEITVHFNLRGRAWQNKQGETVYFNTINAWRLEADTSQQYSGQDAPPAEEPPQDSFVDQLPF